MTTNQLLCSHHCKNCIQNKQEQNVCINSYIWNSKVNNNWFIKEALMLFTDSHKVWHQFRKKYFIKYLIIKNNSKINYNKLTFDYQGWRGCWKDEEDFPRIWTEQLQITSATETSEYPRCLIHPCPSKRSEGRLNEHRLISLYLKPVLIE